MSQSTTRAERVLGLATKLGRWNATCEISPEQARVILENQPIQRPVAQSHVDALVAEIKAGRFVQTNQGIAFDEDGFLFDGQHRLWAVFESGMPIVSLCCFNEPRANFDRVDTIQKTRREGDHLMIDGLVEQVSVGTLVSSAGRFLWSYDLGANPVNASAQKGFSHDSMRGVLARHPHLIATATELVSVRLLFPRAPFVALITLMREADEARANTFLRQALTGENLSAGDPVLTLRASATSNYMKRGARVETSYRIARAWNAFYEDRKIYTLYGSVAAGSAQKARKNSIDPFPLIAGLRHTKRAASKRQEDRRAIRPTTIATLSATH